MTLYDKFILDVKENPDRHCDYVKKAVERHNSDLKKSKKRDYPYYFNREKADEYIELAYLFRHTKGSWRGKPFNLQPFQAFIMAMIFGWLFKDDNLRRYYKLYVDMGRGGGKSEFAAMLQCILFLFDNENTPNIYSCATTRTQAAYVFEPAKEMLRMLSQESEYVNNRVEIFTYYIREATNGRMGTLTSDASKNDGGDIFMGTVDELHGHKDTSMIKIIETGQAKRVGSSPLLLIITTAGHNKQGPGMMYRKITSDILDGHVENDGFFGIIFTLDDDEEANDESKWVKANPALGSTPSLKQLRQNYQNAITEGATAWYEFLTKNMNVYADMPNTWLDTRIVKNCLVEEHPEDLLTGRECYIGLDLSTEHDLSAAPVLFIPTDNDPFYRLRHKFFCPEESKVIASANVDGVDYRQFIADGYIDATKGNVIDYKAIIEWIKYCNSRYRIKCVEYDPWHKSLVIPELSENNIPTDSYSQSYIAMSPVIAEMENLIKKGLILIEKNDVFLWNISNAVLDINRRNDKQKRITKSHTDNKIDGVIATLLAIGGHLTDEKTEEKSVYMTRGVRTV